MGSERDYPYDPRYGNDPDRARLRGLDRLRAIEDRRYARQLYELYFVAQRNEKDPRMQAQLAKEEREKREQDEANLESMTRKALGGTYGSLAQKIATDFMAQHGNTEGALKELRRLLSEMPENSRVSG